MKKAGIFYTNNAIPKEIISRSLESIKVAADKNDVKVITSSWEPLIGFDNYIADHKNKGHFTLYSQILKLLFVLKDEDYDVVSFLEHDTLYGEDFFAYDSFDCNVLANSNYVGLNKQGYQNRPEVNPLHQLTMKLDFAIDYFSIELIKTLHSDVSNVEPSEEYCLWNSNQKSIHINWGGNFTSHFQTFGEVYSNDDPYWGDSSRLIDESFFIK